MRQLGELAVFKQSGDTDRSMRVFVQWVRSSESVAEMQRKIDHKLPRCVRINSNSNSNLLQVWCQ